MTEANKSRRRYLEGIATVGTVGLAGCTQGDGGSPTGSRGTTDDGGTPTDTETATPDDKKGGTLNWAQYAIADEGYDPHQITRGFVDQYAFYDTLIRYEVKDGSPVLKPHLAKNWTMKNQTRIEFTLHDDIKFHDGTTLDAETAKWNFNRMQKDFSTVKSDYSQVESIEVLDDLKFAINLKQPNGPILDTLAASSYMVSKKAAEQHGPENFPQNPVGTGPWVHESHSSSQTVTTRYEDYFREDEVPFPKKFVVKEIPESQTRVSALRDGEIDILASAPASHLKQLRNDESVKVVSSLGKSQTIDYIGFNNEKGPFSDKRVRRAIGYAMNKEEIKQFVNRAEEIDGPILSHLWGNNPDATALPHKPEKAKSLLEEAGHSNLEFTMFVRQAHPSKKQWAELLKSQLSSIGVSMSIQQLTTGTLISKLKNLDYDAHFLHWGGSGSLDPGVQLKTLFHSESAFNFIFNYSNDELDRLIEEGNSMVEQSKRAEKFKQAEKHVMDNAVGNFSLRLKTFLAHKTHLNGVQIEATGNSPIINKIWLDKNQR